MELTLLLTGLSVLCIMLTGFCVYQSTYVSLAKRKRQYLRKAIAKEREATADIINLSRDIITEGTTEEEFLEKFLEYAVRSMHGSGGAVFHYNADDSVMRGIAVSGALPPLKEVTPRMREYMMAHPKKHTSYFKEMQFKLKLGTLEELFSEHGYTYYKESLPDWIDKSFSKGVSALLFAPIRIENRISAIVLVCSDYDYDSYTLRDDDGLVLTRLAATASLGLEVIKVFRERQEYEERLQSAREEGMVQVSTGIIHNIGNAVTVAKLAIHELRGKIPANEMERGDYFIRHDILPLLNESLAEGRIAEFLSVDPTGSQILPMLDELLRNSISSASEQLEMLNSLSSKLDHISEIIDLQQRFVGELGTENMTQIATVVESAVKIFGESFNKRGVIIERRIASDVPEVLIDPSMLTQVFINILKNAIEALEANVRIGKELCLSISLTCEICAELGNSVVVTIRDNGPGITPDILEKIFTFGFSTKRVHGGGYGLHSCITTVRKYGGRIDVESVPGQGAAFKVILPVRKDLSTDTAPTQQLPRDEDIDLVPA